MIDTDGFRANVGIVLCNRDGKLFWARRCGMDAWQFPQGGIRENENVEQAMYRELREETGLLPEHVQVVASTDEWLRYWIPKQFIRYKVNPVCIGQKQIWYLLRLIADDSLVTLSVSQRPEFDQWCWVDYWEPVTRVVEFKRNVYAEALKQLAPYIMPFRL